MSRITRTPALLVFAGTLALTTSAWAERPVHVSTNPVPHVSAHPVPHVTQAPGYGAPDAWIDATRDLDRLERELAEVEQDAWAVRDGSVDYALREARAQLDAARRELSRYGQREDFDRAARAADRSIADAAERVRSLHHYFEAEFDAVALELSRLERSPFARDAAVASTLWSARAFLDSADRDRARRDFGDAARELEQASASLDRASRQIDQLEREHRQSGVLRQRLESLSRSVDNALRDAQTYGSGCHDRSFSDSARYAQELQDRAWSLANRGDLEAAVYSMEQALASAQDAERQGRTWSTRPVYVGTHIEPHHSAAPRVTYIQPRPHSPSHRPSHRR